MIARQLPHRVERYIDKYHLIQSQTTLLVGVSGGTDSVCLLHVLVSLKDRLGIDLKVIHLNHLLRGTESYADAAYVAELAQGLDVAVITEDRDVTQYKDGRGCSLEEAAREVRYAVFAETAERIGADAVAVAHTANDQAETVLMHLTRGTGLTGLCGMRPLSQWVLSGVNPLKVVRPLLEISREDIEEYCVENELFPRYDSSNESMEFLRNRIRMEIMPRLIDYNPNVVESLTRTARLIEDDIEYLDVQVEKVFDSIVDEIPRGMSLDNKLVDSLPLGLKRHLLRTVLGRLAGSLRDVELVHIESIVEVLKQPAGKEIALPYGLTFYGDYERSYVAQGGNPLLILPPLDGEHSLSIPGETNMAGWRVKATVIEGVPEESKSDLQAFLDFDMSGTALIVRGRADGDRFQPLGMEDSKKLQDFMVDAKIPRVWRDNVPLVCSGDQIVWVAGWRISHQVRVTDSTRRVLHLEFEME